MGSISRREFVSGRVVDQPQLLIMENAAPAPRSLGHPYIYTRAETSCYKSAREGVPNTGMRLETK